MTSPAFRRAAGRRCPRAARGGRFKAASGRGFFDAVQGRQGAGKAEEKEQEAVHHGETPDFSGVVSAQGSGKDCGGQVRFPLGSGSLWRDTSSGIDCVSGAGPKSPAPSPKSPLPRLTPKCSHDLTPHAGRLEFERSQVGRAGQPVIGTFALWVRLSCGTRRLSVLPAGFLRNAAPFISHKLGCPGIPIIGKTALCAVFPIQEGVSGEIVSPGSYSADSQRGRRERSESFRFSPAPRQISRVRL